MRIVEITDNWEVTNYDLSIPLGNNKHLYCASIHVNLKSFLITYFESNCDKNNE